MWDESYGGGGKMMMIRLGASEKANYAIIKINH